MSYCRFSSDNFRCDIYAYDDVAGGITIFVAGGRYNEPIPEVPPCPIGDEYGSDRWNEWFAAHNAQSDYLQDAGTTPINLPRAGEAFYGLDAEDAISLLLDLREEGFKFPDHVIESLQEEAEGEA